MSLLTVLGLCALTAAAGDTITVSEAAATEPATFRTPYQTDSLNGQGKAYDTSKILEDNAAIVRADGLFSRTVKNGDAVVCDTAGTAATLSAFRFALNADRFTKLSLRIPRLASHATYLNGTKHGDGDITLTPGRTEVTVLALTKPTDRDTFRVEVTGKDLAGLTVGTSGKRAYTMSLMLEGDHYRNVSLSPSGNYLATIYYNTKADGTNLFRTVVSEVATGRSLMRRDSYMNLQWLPRRDVLYYTRQGAEGTEMVTFDPRTLKEEVVATNLPESHFALSPGGDYAILTRTQQGREEGNKDLKRMEQPDDHMNGWRGRSAIYRYDFKRRTTEQLTFGNTSVWLSDISPDGRRLLLSTYRFDPTRQPFNYSSVLEMDAYTGRVDTVFADTAWISNVSYSPDGRQLLVKGSPAAFGGIGNEVPEGMHPNSFDYRLYLHDLASHATTPLLSGFKPSVNSTVWAYGDNNIYFSADDGFDISLFRLDPRTKKVTKFALPVTAILGYSVAAGQRTPRAVVFGQTGERARDMYLTTLSSAAPKTKRIGEVDFDSLMAGVAIGECHDWDFRSSRGDTIRGFYFLPPDFDASKRYPMIVYYYGGCTPTTKTLEFQYPLQVLAGQGYVVYVCEPSGAIGFGQEFAARHVNTWGKGSADDIIEGTKTFLKEHPYVNPEKVGCMGASYGGFMTEYLQTRTDIFAAAISHAGISNIASYWGGGYWGYSYGETAQYGSYPWNNPELYVRQSPLFSADKIHTPLLLLHGTADTNVPTTESQQLFTALRILGRPVSYVRVDGENHVITNFKKRLAWQNVIFAWFAHWLKDQPAWWETLYPGDDFGVKK